MSLERLEHFLAEIESDRGNPSRNRIESLGIDLVSAAKERQGYSRLVWQAGVYLLILASEYPDLGVDHFYHQYGYRAVANALSATLKNGDFPLGLGFIVHGFLPSDGLDGLLSTDILVHEMKKLHFEHFKVSVDRFRSVSPDLRRASALFLKNSANLDISPSCRLQMISSLFLATPPDAWERELVCRVFLDTLNSDSRDINSFYCWSALVEDMPALLLEPDYLSSLVSVLRRCKGLGDQAPSTLAQILENHHVLSAATRDNFELLLLLGLAGWWAYVHHEFGQGLDMAWELIFALSDDYPAISNALKGYLQSGQSGALSPEEIKQLQLDFQESMRSLHRESRLRSYRGVPLALQIQRDNLVNIFEPLYEALEGSSMLSEELAERIRTIDASDLVDGNPLQKASRFPIQGELRLQMISDHQKIIDALYRAFELRQKLDRGVQGNSVPEFPFLDPVLVSELADLAERYVNLDWAIRWFLPNVGTRSNSEGTKV